MYSHPKCYASRLGGCSEEISREHYISESILRLLGKKAFLAGPNRETQALDVEDLGFEILCRTHNNGLNLVDEAAKKVFRALIKFNKQLAPGYIKGAAPTGKVVVNGWLFERWVLKLYCGLKATGHFRDRHPIPGYVIDAVFKGVPLPLDLGLYMTMKVKDLIWIGKTFGVQQAIREDTGETCAAVVSFAGITFHCSVAPSKDGGTGKVDGQDRHIPGLILRDEKTGYSRELEFTWS